MIDKYRNSPFLASQRVCTTIVVSIYINHLNDRLDCFDGFDGLDGFDARDARIYDTRARGICKFDQSMRS
jgi:hypothetical protein